MAKPEFSADVIVSTDYSLIGSSSVYGRITVGTAAVEVKVGTSRLEGRTTVTIQAHPDNTGYIYLGIDNTVTATKYFYVLMGGSALELTLDSTDDMQVWAIASAAGQFAGLIEGRA